ncbi:MAG: hypothetical protein GKR77_07730, partial [Legionellales bacterium]|nr:hypothetical protein [Legionellales bacterium]
FAVRHCFITDEQASTIINDTLPISCETVFIALIKTHAVNASLLAQSIAQQTQHPLITLPNRVTQLPYQAFSLALLLQYRLIPYQQTKTSFLFACAFPPSSNLIHQLQFRLGQQIQFGIVDFTQFRDVLTQLTQLLRQQYLQTYWQVDANQTSTMIADFLTQLTTHAVEIRASDIHCESHTSQAMIRLRVDGLLHPLMQLPLSIAQQLTAHIKVLARLDIAEQRLPQDGHYQLKLQSAIYDLRVSVCPTSQGEKIVTRVLTGLTHPLATTQLGMTDSQHQQFQHAIHQPYGLILVTGPTGSGKTLTLYTALQHIQHVSKNIVTVEDPIEIQLPGIHQIQVNTKIDLTFSCCLRALLRQDPDIIMIGEIRDPQTARIAIQAAQTGHLVFATLHTHSAKSSIKRLTQMGIPANHLLDSLLLIINQRLLRKRCLQCQTNDSTHCPACHAGYHGRCGVFELIPFEHDENTIAKHPGDSLLQAAQRKIDQGITDHTEVTRVIQLGSTT